MNPVTTALTLNMQLPNIAAVSWAVQGDQLSREIEATLVDGSTAWNPQVGYHGVVRFHKPDGTSGVYDVDEDGNPAVTWTGNVATVKIVQQALTVAGTVLMQLEFYDANEARVTAFGWANNVQPSAVTDDEFLSSDYYNILTLQIAGVLGAAGHSPYIDNVTNHWMIWDSNINDYVDSGVYATGPAPTLQSTSYEYANDASGTTPPASGWSGTRPAPVQGQFSWTKTTLTFDSGTTVYYTVAYQGIDGAGADFVKAIIAQEEASTTAANAYAVGDYFILANVLYVATAAIQIGDPITPGTNCTQTTVSAELVSIKNTLNQLAGDIAVILQDPAQDTFTEGTYVVYNNQLYTVNAGGIPAGTAASAYYPNMLTAVSVGGLNHNPVIVTNSNGTAYKFSSGLMICVIRTVQTVATTTQSGAMYSGSVSSLPWPVSFVGEVPTVTCGNTGNNGGLVDLLYPTSLTHTGNIYILRTVPSEDNYFILNIIGIGRWK